MFNVIWGLNSTNKREYISNQIRILQLNKELLEVSIIETVNANNYWDSFIHKINLKEVKRYLYQSFKPIDLEKIKKIILESKYWEIIVIENAHKILSVELIKEFQNKDIKWEIFVLLPFSELELENLFHT